MEQTRISSYMQQFDQFCNSNQSNIQKLLQAPVSISDHTQRNVHVWLGTHVKPLFILSHKSQRTLCIFDFCVRLKGRVGLNILTMLHTIRFYNGLL